MDVIEFLRLNNVPLHMKERGNIYVTCQGCGKDNLSISRDTGLWHCWTTGCGRKGNFRQLCEELGVKNVPEDVSFRPSTRAEERILSVDDIEKLERFKQNKAEIIEWALSRNLEPDLCFRYGVGFDTDQQAVVFSYYDEKGKLVGYKSKAINERLVKGKMIKPQWTTGREPLLYLPQTSDLKKEKIVLVEGEVDALTLKGMGIPAVASLGTTKDRGFELLKDMRRIFIGYDMDEAGLAGSQMAAEKLGPFRCRRVSWGEKDVNDWAQEGATRQDVMAALEGATKYVESASALSAHEAVMEYYDAHEAGLRPRRSWGWSRLDSFTKGIGGGELIGIQAESNTGKTTWLLNVIRNFASSGMACGFASLEEHPLYEITPKLYSCLLGRNISTHQLTRTDAAVVAEQLKRIHLYRKKVDLKEVLDFIRECYYEHDCKMVAIDYFQLLLSDEESVQNVKDTIFALKHMTIECPDLTIILVIQPKQLSENTFGRGPNTTPRPQKLGKNSGRGGSPIGQTVDKLLSISPLKGHPNVTQYEYVKVRGHLNVSHKDWQNRFTQLIYDHDTLRMEELDHLIYDF